MHFTKMQGDGNDYVYVDCTKENVEDPEKTAVKVSDRHFGIGSDGLILIKPSETADFTMDMYNADGSRGAMCGNGIRCVAKYVYDHGMVDRDTITIETRCGIKTLKLSVGDGKVKEVRVDMGAPILEAEKIPILPAGEKDISGPSASKNAEASRVISEPIAAAGLTYKMTGVSMGNPHAVVFISEDPAKFPLEAVGPVFEHHERFPDRINTEFAYVMNGHEIKMRVWERGSGETLACGTGACATAVAGILNGFTKSPVTIHLTGGDLTIEWEGEGKPVFMTGPAEEVFEGEINV
jgi:diaminopimelate epimerase